MLPCCFAEENWVTSGFINPGEGCAELLLRLGLRGGPSRDSFPSWTSGCLSHQMAAQYRHIASHGHGVSAVQVPGEETAEREAWVQTLSQQQNGCQGRAGWCCGTAGSQLGLRGHQGVESTFLQTKLVHIQRNLLHSTLFTRAWVQREQDLLLLQAQNKPEHFGLSSPCSLGSSCNLWVTGTTQTYLEDLCTLTCHNGLRVGSLKLWHDKPVPQSLGHPCCTG